MPRVPLLSGPSVRLRPLNTPETRPEAEGIGMAVGLETAAKVVSGFGEIIERADKAVVENAEVGFAREVDQIFVNEAQDGFLQRKGTAVRDAYQQLGEQFDSAEQAAMKNLNPRQREIFKQTAARSRVAAMRRADDYLDRELRVLEDTNSKALQQTAFSRIALDVGDPALVQAHVTEIAERAAADATRAGLDTPAKDALVAEARSTARYAQIAALVDADKIDEASKTLELYNDELTDPQQRQQAKQLVEQETMRVRSQKEADRIIAESGKSERDALAKARQLSGEMRDDVERRITTYYNQQAQLTKQDQSDALDAVAAQLEQTGNLNFLRGEQLQTIQNIPGAISALQERARQIQRFGIVGGRAVGRGNAPATGTTDWNLYTRLVTDAQNNPQALVDVNPALVRPYLGNTEFKWFVDARAKAMSGDVEGARVAGQTEFSLQSMILGEAAAMGALGQYTSLGQMVKPAERRIYNTMATETRSRIIAAETKGPISPAAKLQITREVVADVAQREGKTVTMPKTPTPIPMGSEVTINTWSAYITQQGGVPTLTKIAKLEQVGRRFQPPAYTDADRQGIMRRIALEP